MTVAKDKEAEIKSKAWPQLYTALTEAYLSDIREDKRRKKHDRAAQSKSVAAAKKTSQDWDKRHPCPAVVQSGSFINRLPLLVSHSNEDEILS
ncbi:hypothetical protein PoB_002216700 [Plakobranchus ocellatus]|uniref:Uncharacterized protein n=1 Tax=Plakobranchus ocellatus TaxID=259542 RepID=A0AAV3ZMB0_9GAST|nr:hypothetical protein PoB_002216700 [Plakobranchus ocellatus]